VIGQELLIWQHLEIWEFMHFLPKYSKFSETKVKPQLVPGFAELKLVSNADRHNTRKILSPAVTLHTFVRELKLHYITKLIDSNPGPLTTILSKNIARIVLQCSKKYPILIRFSLLSFVLFLPRSLVENSYKTFLIASVYD
jgi:hypothetical protein